MRFPLLAIALALVGASCTEPDAGGFGKADVQQPGVHVKPSKEPTNAPPDFAAALKMQPAYGDGQVTVTVALQEGYHAYAAGESIGKPVALTLKDANGWKPEGDVVVPAGVQKDLGELGKSQVLEGTFALQQKCAGGTGEIEGELEIQICTDNACDRPRKHPFKVAAPSS